MEKFTVTAMTNEGGKKVLVGSREIDKPNTLAEAVSIEGGEAGVLKGYWKSKVIEVQAQIRSGAEVTEQLKTFKGLSPEKQAELITKARELGLIS
jgi:hypothetical protein